MKELLPETYILIFSSAGSENDNFTEELPEMSLI